MTGGEIVPASEIGAGDFIVFEGAVYEVVTKRRYKVGTEARAFVLAGGGKDRRRVEVDLANDEPVTRYARWGEAVPAGRFPTKAGRLGVAP